MTKEIKHFFTENNQLNKGSGVTSHQYIQKVRQEFEDLMPAPEILQAYEEIMPGTVAKLVEMMQQEQNHKHALEQSKIFMRTRSEMIGRLFSVLIVLIIGYVTLKLAQDSLSYAVVFAAVAFASIFGISFLSYYRSSAKNNFIKPKASVAGYDKSSAEEAVNEKEPISKDSLRDKNNYRKPIYKKKRG